MWKVSPAEEGAVLYSPRSDDDRHFLPEEEEYQELEEKESRVHTPQDMDECPLELSICKEEENRLFSLSLCVFVVDSPFAFQ